MEQIVISEYYEVLFSRFKYSELVFTAEEILIVPVGESLKNILTRGDPAGQIRENFSKLLYHKMKVFNNEVVVISKGDIQYIKHTLGTHFKNSSIHIKTSSNTYRFYSKNKKNKRVDNYINSYL